MAEAATIEARPQEPGWPATAGARVLFLLDASSRLEAGLLRRWIEDARPETVGPQEVRALEIPASRRRGRRRPDPRLEAALATGDDPLLAPLRVIWLPPERDGRRVARFSDLLRLGDPRDPGRLRERLVLQRAPDRCRIVAAEPAPLSELRERWRAAAGKDVAETVGIAEFVARQAALALDRAERRERGARYKVPRFVREDILARPAVRGGLAELARRLGRREVRVMREADRCLGEIAATHSPLMIDLFTQICRSLYSRGYGDLRFDASEFDRLRPLAQRHPLVFLPTHKSNLDHPVLRYALHEQGFPPSHTAGGINMNFFPMGPLARRAGTFFIRRSFKDDPVYKLVLRSYIDYLIEKRFPLEWYIEGGRSRSGKLLPPRYGLLSYVVDAYRRGKSDDVWLVPVSITYDQISDVGDYASEQLGGAKQRESFGWFLGVLRRLESQYGNIDLRLGEPLSLRKALGPPESLEEGEPAGEPRLPVQKLAFEVCARINRVTPITPTALAMLALLGCGDRAVSTRDLSEPLAELVDNVARRGLPTTERLELTTPEEIGRTLDSLVRGGVLARHDDGLEPVYAIRPGQHLAAAYYRNTVIHFFVSAGIAELALLRAVEAGSGDGRAAFWTEVMALRDLLKFEFFFSEKQAFQEEIRRELALQDAGFEEALTAGPESLRSLLVRIRPLVAHRILRPFLEATSVAAERLAALGDAALSSEPEWLASCLAAGHQYTRQRRIHCPDAVSKVLFGNALRLARNRDLIGPGTGSLAGRRRAFFEEVRGSVRRVEAIAALDAARSAGFPA